MAAGAASDLAFPFPPPWSENISVQFNISSSSSFHLSSKTKYPRYPHLSVKRSRCSPISPPHFEGKSVSSPQWHLVAKETVASGILWTRKQHSKQLATEVLPNPSNLLRIRQLCDRLLMMSAKLPIVSIAQLLVWNWVTDIDCTPSSGLLECVIKPSSLLYHNFHNCWRENPYHSCQYDGKV